jgi:hypothetical protein
LTGHRVTSAVVAAVARTASVSIIAEAEGGQAIERDAAALEQLGPSSALSMKGAAASEISSQETKRSRLASNCTTSRMIARPSHFACPCRGARYGCDA